MTPAPSNTLRFVLLAFITGTLGVGIHLMLIRGLGEEAVRHMPAFAIFIAAMALGIGCAAMSEAMRQTQMTLNQAWDKGGAFMPRAFVWAAFSPAAFAGLWPMPTAGLVIAGITTPAPVTIVLGFLSLLALASLWRIPLAYSATRFSHPTDRATIEASTLLAIWGVVVLTGAPVLPNILLI